MSSIKAVFLDRDGVLTPALAKDTYLLEVGQARILPEALPGLRLFAAQAPLFIVSNQQCVGKQLISLTHAETIQRHVMDQLEQLGVPVRDFRLCPHLRTDNCVCRKPKPGMILDLCQQYNLNPQESVLIGDSLSDIEAGRTAGCQHSFYLRSSAEQIQPLDPTVVCVDNLLSAYHACFAI